MGNAEREKIPTDSGRGNAEKAGRTSTSKKGNAGVRKNIDEQCEC